MIRIYTGTTFNALLARHRKDITRDITAEHVNAIEKKLLPLPCKHRGGVELEKCLTCVTRKTVRAAVDAVLDTGSQP